MLEVSGVTKHFGGLIAVDDVDFDINEGEIVGLIGPNGAGKTTLFNTITGIYQPDEGTIQFNGHDLTQMKPHQVCKLGVSRTFQIVRTFNESTVLDNVTIGVMFGSEEKMSVSEARKKAEKHIEFVGLEGKEEDLAKNLTIADRKLVELARALANEPDLVLLDEI
ncbi:MAG: ATP-binding cassette domain-containing protein, partial [Halobacteria archaeon]|nr:ATP-binding cassette domain-containing protein [Halobacteria archaeon]